MGRTSAEALGKVSEDDLTATLDRLGVRHTPGSKSGADLVLIDLDGRAMAIEIKSTAYATPERVRAMIERRPTSTATALLVADHITETARQELARAGWSWLDRRGHLRLYGPGVMIDREVDALPRPGHSGPRHPIAGAAGRAVAYSILIEPYAPQPVRASGRRLGFSPASVSNARSVLRDAGLLERDGLPVVPELFWALADVWSAERIWLSKLPAPSDTHTSVRDLTVPGWCITGTAAAVEWGAPVVAVDPLLDIYVPGPVLVSIARREYGSADGAAEAAASIAVAPASLVTSRREPPRGTGRWPLAHPLAVALDLAEDHARGRAMPRRLDTSRGVPPCLVAR